VRWTCSRTSKDLNFLPSFFFQTKSWQKHQYLSDSNKIADFININKEFLAKESSQKILPKKSSQKNPPPKKSSKKIPPKKILQKKSKKNPKNSSKKSQKNPKTFQTISQKVPNFENIQFPTSHLEAETPFELVYASFQKEDGLIL
jgi:hypothetical protein